jgi:hypothetical protein
MIVSIPVLSGELIGSTRVIRVQEIQEVTLSPLTRGAGIMNNEPTSELHLRSQASKVRNLETSAKAPNDAWILT